MNDDDTKAKKLRTRYRILLDEYAEIKRRVNEYSRRPFLHPGEEMEHRTLQRMKLFRKDALGRIAAELEATEQRGP